MVQTHPFALQLVLLAHFLADLAIPKGTGGFHVNVLETLHVSPNDPLLLEEGFPSLLPRRFLGLLLAKGAGRSQEIEGLSPVGAHHKGRFPFPAPLLKHLHGVANGLLDAVARLQDVAIAWLLAKGDHVVPIPGTRSIEHLDELASGADLDLSPSDIETIEKVLPVGWCHGDRYTADQWQGPERYC